jgi:hypothetical protein
MPEPPSRPMSDRLNLHLLGGAPSSPGHYALGLEIPQVLLARADEVTESAILLCCMSQVVACRDD